MKSGSPSDRTSLLSSPDPPDSREGSSPRVLRAGSGSRLPHHIVIDVPATMQAAAHGDASGAPPSPDSHLEHGGGDGGDGSDSPSRPLLAPSRPMTGARGDDCPGTATEFSEVVEAVRAAIACGRQPDRISQGSSGSYFCRDADGDVVGVFKPKNEEPYGKLNPKWTKWLHKNLLPCCFGRSCLIPNLGYISEAAASLVDRHLFAGKHIVPWTEVVSLASPAFYYSKRDLRNLRRKQKPLPEKSGSFQIFMRGYVDAIKFLRGHHQEGTKGVKLSARVQREFQADFERLVILDYLIRNTDRGLDNWMVRYDADGSRTATAATSPTTPGVSTTPITLASAYSSTASPSISIAAIDNGLAFPHKHPDHWRSYPYGWASLPISAIPFSAETRQAVLPLLKDASWWDRLEKALQRVFRLDKDYDEVLWRRQWALIRGQGYNLLRSLRKDGSTPLDLVSMERIFVFEHEEFHAHRPSLEANALFHRIDENPQALDSAFDASFVTAAQMPDPGLPSAAGASASGGSNSRQQQAKHFAQRGKSAAILWKGKVLSYVKRRPWFSYF